MPDRPRLLAAESRDSGAAAPASTTASACSGASAAATTASACSGASAAATTASATAAGTTRPTGATLGGAQSSMRDRISEAPKPIDLDGELSSLRVELDCLVYKSRIVPFRGRTTAK
jgi:hypothetical protein